MACWPWRSSVPRCREMSEIKTEMPRTIRRIDGIDYIEIPDTELPCGNACRQCAFYGTACYDRDDFTCHADARPDGVDVVYRLARHSDP